MRNLILILLLGITFASCEPHEYYGMVTGEWEGTDWTRAGSDVNLTTNNTVYFNFNADKTYEATLGQSKQTGTYKFTDDFLQFFPEGLSELRVSVIKLDPHYLQIRMDNNGIEEILSLKKIVKEETTSPVE